MTFQEQLLKQMGKIKGHNPSKAETKQAIKEALKLSPPTAKEREEFLKHQTPEGKATFLEAEKSLQTQTAITQPKNVVRGLGIGAALALVMGAPLLVPLGLAGGAYYVYNKHKPGCMTPERQKVYEAALKTLKDPVKLRALADAFEKEGCTKEAEILRKRAALRELPPDVKKGRKQAFKKGLQSTNVHGIEALADRFEGEGATGAAEALRIHAAALKSL